ncbi:MULTISPECIES: DNA polymerase IV [unclassified Sporolactobacillus]|uniref:DNA polymerase IV n=1 Tax=unclassified Sporolactobacillus TaxID=2628533 RepID=UPI00236775F7|nr:DNA polymerase IV [Sporolactobacillus sp. CQH2019]MDD9150467.1 DNA polymerase IV [Sporolactobacillus sp. CQH2019]
MTKQKVIFLVDMQTFYASCEKADLPELKDRPVIVAGDPKQRSGIVLAACPMAKSYGVKTGEGLWEARKKCPMAVIRIPRMQHYLDISIKITGILETFTELVEPYSVDEQFMDVTGSQHLFGRPREIARKIQLKIWHEIGIYARVGIGPNKVMAKMACDNFAKKNKSGIFELTHENIQQYLWPLPIKSLFSVGTRMEKNLLLMGIRTIKGLANYPISLLEKRWGINGTLLWMTAQGIDYSPVTPGTFREQKAIGHHMTLPYDYKDEKSIRIVLLELSEEVAYRARTKGYQGDVVSTGITGEYDRHTGFYRQIKLTSATDFGMDIFQAACKLLTENWDREPVRGVSVTLSDLRSVSPYQLDLFGKVEEKKQLSAAVDAIYAKYGKPALFHGSSLLPGGQWINRARKIGGHFK